MSKLAAKKIASKQDSKIEKLKQELAAAEAAKKGGSDSSDSDSDSSDKSSSDAEDQSTVQSLVTANDFKKLPEPVAKNTDNHIAKEAGPSCLYLLIFIIVLFTSSKFAFNFVVIGAGLKPMGWMGSKEEIDDTLRKYGCDPTSFVCKGSPAQKKIIAKKLQELQVKTSNIYVGSFHHPIVLTPLIHCRPL